MWRVPNGLDNATLELETMMAFLSFCMSPVFCFMSIFTLTGTRERHTGNAWSELHKQQNSNTKLGTVKAA